MIESLVDRSKYPILESMTYLNQASIGLIGQPAVEAMHAFLDDSARHGNVHMIDVDEVRFFESLRSEAATLFNCSTGCVAITAGASEILGQLPLLMGEASAQDVVMVASDFPALTRPWVLAVQQGRGTIHWISDVPNIDLTEALIDSITERTSVVAVSHVQFSTGTLLDIPRLRAAASRVGAALVVDVTQSAGTYAADSALWQADVIVCSGYKWLGGHGGVAISYMAEHLYSKTPALAGWMGSPNPFQFDAKTSEFSQSARRFTLSTMSYISLVGLTTSLQELGRLSAEEKTSHAGGLANYLVESLAGSDWSAFRSLTDAGASSHIVPLVHPEQSANSVVTHLREAGVCCSSRNGRVRISIAPYTNSVDLDQLVEVLVSSQKHSPVS